MMNKKNLLAITIALLSFTLINCGKDTTKKDSDTDKTKVTDTTKKAPVTPTINKDSLVIAISVYRGEGEKKLLDNTLKRKTVDLKTSTANEDTKQKWEKVDGYFEGDKLVRIQTYPHKGISERTEEFYVKDGKLLFAFIQDSGVKHEGKDTGEPGKEFYFDNNKLIKYVNTSGEKDADLDATMKMYESKLPVEVNELIGLLKDAK